MGVGSMGVATYVRTWGSMGVGQHGGGGGAAGGWGSMGVGQNGGGAAWGSIEWAMGSMGVGQHGGRVA